MGTRSLTVIRGNQEILVMDRQYDGCIDGYGHELAEFLSGFKIVNGVWPRHERKIAVGAKCLATQIVCHFKKGVGDFYLYPAGTRNQGEEYIYFVTALEHKPIHIEVESNGKQIFSGLPEELALFNETYDET